jgi:hypothetical protein
LSATLHNKRSKHGNEQPNNGNHSDNGDKDGEETKEAFL